MLMQSPAVEARKLLVDEKITACVKQMSLQGVVCKVLNRKKNSLVKHSAFLKKICSQHLNFVLQVSYCFLMLQIGPQPTFSECIVFFL